MVIPAAVGVVDVLVAVDRGVLADRSAAAPVAKAPARCPISMR